MNASNNGTSVLDHPATSKTRGRGRTAVASPDTSDGIGPTTITIKPPKIHTATFTIKGTAPLMQARFSAKAMQQMMDKRAAGSTAKSKKERKPRDFDEDFKSAMHISTDGWVGIPAAAFRNACIDACRLVNYKMTVAKMSVFCVADGNDHVDGQPLVRLAAGDPERTEMAVRNQTGVADIRIRPMWREWGATVRLRFDADQFTLQDVANLLSRAGMQIGIGEGRPFSRESNGLGYGTFEIVGSGSIIS